MHALIAILLSVFMWTDDYNSSVDYLRQNRDSFVASCTKHNTDTAVAMSVIFPELVRFSYFQDFFETQSLELLYVNFGPSKADFSIGRFQMKPSFIEQLETMVKSKQLDKFTEITQYTDTDIRKIRQERLLRLQNYDWQLKYLNCFCSFMENRFIDHLWKDKEQKIAVFATAFNHSMTCSLEELKDWSSRKNYPYGSRSEDNPYTYSEIALLFYVKDYPTLIK